MQFVLPTGALRAPAASLFSLREHARRQLRRPVGCGPSHDIFPLAEVVSMNYFMWQDAPAIYCFAMPVMDWTYSTAVHALVPKLWRCKNAKNLSCTMPCLPFHIMSCPPFHVSPTPRLELGTPGLEVRCAIHCATWANSKKNTSRAISSVFEGLNLLVQSCNRGSRALAVALSQGRMRLPHQVLKTCSLSLLVWWSL